MSGLRKPLEDVMTKLRGLTVTTADGVRQEPFVRVWNNQVSYDRKGEHYGFPKPAIFVEVMMDARYDVIGQGYLSADLGWRIHLVHEFYNAEGTMEQDLDVFDLRDQITTQLSGFLPTACSSLFKVSETLDHDHDSIYHYVIDFASNFIDSTGSDDDRGLFIWKQPTTNLGLTVNEVPTLAAYTPDTTIFNVPQS
jgi:hypothetical protein